MPPHDSSAQRLPRLRREDGSRPTPPVEAEDELRSTGQWSPVESEPSDSGNDSRSEFTLPDLVALFGFLARLEQRGPCRLVLQSPTGSLHLRLSDGLLAVDGLRPDPSTVCSALALQLPAVWAIETWVDQETDFPDSAVPLVTLLETWRPIEKHHLTARFRRVLERLPAPPRVLLRSMMDARNTTLPMGLSVTHPRAANLDEVLHLQQVALSCCRALAPLGESAGRAHLCTISGPDEAFALFLDDQFVTLAVIPSRHIGLVVAGQAAPSPT